MVIIKSIKKTMHHFPLHTITKINKLQLQLQLKINKLQLQLQRSINYNYNYKDQ